MSAIRCDSPPPQRQGASHPSAPRGGGATPPGSERRARRGGERVASATPPPAGRLGRPLGKGRQALRSEEEPLRYHFAERRRTGERSHPSSDTRITPSCYCCAFAGGGHPPTWT